MRPGDAQRAWFTEMLDELRTFWRPDIPWQEVIDFCARMTSLRENIRRSRGIQSPMMTCRKYGSKGRAKLRDVSPRSLLFALRKIEVVTGERLKELDRSWKKYRKANGLDAYGKKEESQP